MGDEYDSEQKGVVQGVEANVRHVGLREAAEGAASDVGDGPPDTAPDLPAEEFVGVTETDGLSPKAIVAAALPLVAGILLALIDKLVADDSIDDSIWWGLIAASPLAGGGAFAASPGKVTRKLKKD
jgi:hypothetical protein